MSDGWHSPMAVRVLDTRTGATGLERRGSPHDWLEGNWSCDCNRAEAVGVELRDTGTCHGCVRFLAIGCDYAGLSMDDLNPNYPESLIEEFASYWQAVTLSPSSGPARSSP